MADMARHAGVHSEVWKHDSTSYFKRQTHCGNDISFLHNIVALSVFYRLIESYDDGASHVDDTAAY